MYTMARIFKRRSISLGIILYYYIEIDKYSIIPKVFRSEFFAISVILFEEMIVMIDIK